MKLLKIPSQKHSKKWLERHWQNRFSSQMFSRRSLIFLSVVGCCFTNWISPPAALTLGILFALTLENPFPMTSKFVAKYLLQICVVLLGFTMNLAIVWQTGRQGALFAAGS